MNKKQLASIILGAAFASTAALANDGKPADANKTKGKCGGVEKNATKGKCGAGKCGAGKCGASMGK